MGSDNSALPLHLTSTQTSLKMRSALLLLLLSPAVFERGKGEGLLAGRNFCLHMAGKGTNLRKEGEERVNPKGKWGVGVGWLLGVSLP